MVTVSGGYCDKCRRRNPVGFRVEPEEAWRTVLMNRWRKICPSCFDVEAEKAGVPYKVRGRGCDVLVRSAAAYSATIWMRTARQSG